MKISKKSWHYRMLNHFPWKIRNWETYSLCGYFWLTIWTFVFCLVVVPVCAVALVGAVLTVGMVILSPILQFFFEIPSPVVIFGGFVDGVLLVILWCWYRKHYVNSDMCSETASLVGQYISAKHRKVCPLLDFE
jgi:hypothetical protein